MNLLKHNTYMLKHIKREKHSIKGSIYTVIKTYIIPKDDLPLEKYPLQSDVRFVKRSSNGKDKTFVVEKKNFTDFNEQSENNTFAENQEEADFIEESENDMAGENQDQV